MLLGVPDVDFSSRTSISILLIGEVTALPRSWFTTFRFPVPHRSMGYEVLTTGSFLKQA